MRFTFNYTMCRIVLLDDRGMVVDEMSPGEFTRLFGLDALEHVLDASPVPKGRTE